MSLDTKILNNKEILDAVNKRRNFAIISHPDAGKTIYKWPYPKISHGRSKENWG